MALMNYPSSSEVHRSTLNGCRVLQLEEIRLGSDSYHMMEYVIVDGFWQYYIQAGSKNSMWASGGEDSLNAIINSVQLNAGGNC